MSQLEIMQNLTESLLKHGICFVRTKELGEDLINFVLDFTKAQSITFERTTVFGPFGYQIRLVKIEYGISHDRVRSLITTRYRTK